MAGNPSRSARLEPWRLTNKVRSCQIVTVSVRRSSVVDAERTQLAQPLGSYAQPLEQIHERNSLTVNVGHPRLHNALILAVFRVQWSV
jgi:hypothetical protein